MEDLSSMKICQFWKCWSHMPPLYSDVNVVPICVILKGDTKIITKPGNLYFIPNDLQV